MDADIWLPLATLVLGWAGAQVTEVLRDRRTTTRERLARQAELQRMTLLELQEGLGGAFLSFLLAHLDESELEFSEARRNSRATRERVRLLTSRVEDARVRELVTTLVKAADTQLEPTEPESAQRLMDLHAAYREAVARIGKLLRERY
jgi:hypothetical protein